MKKYLPVILCALLLNCCCVNTFADVRLPAIIGSHMVLQQNRQVKIWGWCDPGEKVSINASWDTATVAAVGSSGATWSLLLKTPAAGGPYTITIKASNTIVLEDVATGEVWDCSGQSNMEMNFNWGVKEYTTEAENADNKQIRFFHIPRLTAAYPQDDTKGSWVVCNPADMKKFSLVGYFFGQKLQQALNVPVGLINASWGGTPAETWTPEEAIGNNKILQEASLKLKPTDWWPVKPAITYNAMISPITNYSIAGVIWYQGESNVSIASTYTSLFTTMISSWRKAWGMELPFYFVQIAPYSGYDSISGALLREAQTKALSLPNTGMVITQDLVGDIKDIHPHDKKDVGVRLANYALAQTYGKTGIAYKSPLYKSMVVQKGNIIISFTGADNGLASKGGALTDFYIAGEDKIFVPAVAVIKGNTLVVSNKAIKKPTAVRFGFNNVAMPNLFNKEGLPVGIFRTDVE